MTSGKPWLAAASALVLVFAGTAMSAAQDVGRNAPAPEPGQGNVPDFGLEPPEGIEPLERDFFSTDDFYQDVELWSDPRYFRCNSGRQLTDMQTNLNPNQSTEVPARIGTNPPDSARWGDCSVDFPVEDILSPYGFDSAQDHYEAILAEVEANGGPTEHTRETMPVLDGWYARPRNDATTWNFGRVNQVPTLLSLVTPQYQQRWVQSLYHEANNDAAQWPAQYCYPEGFVRWWGEFAIGRIQILSTPDLIQLNSGNTMNFMRQIMIGQEFNMEGAVPRIGEDVARWHGETVGFWDEDQLITWTSNVQGWMQHTLWEYSNQLQTVEIFTPQYGEDGELNAIEWDTTFYDPEVLVEPVRIVRTLARESGLDAEPYVFIECLQNIYEIDGRATRIVPGQTIEFTLPDYFDRPWARSWEENFEQDMERPEDGAELFGF